MAGAALTFDDLPSPSSKALAFDDLPAAPPPVPVILPGGEHVDERDPRLVGYGVNTNVPPFQPSPLSKFASRLGEAINEPWEGGSTYQTSPEEEGVLRKIPETAGLQGLVRTGLASGNALTRAYESAWNVLPGAAAGFAEAFGAEPGSASSLGRDVNILQQVAPIAAMGAAPSGVPEPVARSTAVLENIAEGKPTSEPRPVTAPPEPVPPAPRPAEGYPAPYLRKASPAATRVPEPPTVLSFDDLPDARAAPVSTPIRPKPSPSTPTVSPRIAQFEPDLQRHSE